MRHKRTAIAVSAAAVAIAIGGCKASTSSTAGAPPSALASSAKPLASVPGAELTAPEQQAVTSAQGYLRDGQGFSYNGLLRQLTSGYEGFKHADAVFALKYLHPDWNAQAVISARGYLKDGQGFSRQGLIAQLTSAYEGFTEAQAVYAVNKAGL